MKLNNGKGWEAIKQHPSQHHLHAPNAVPNASARALAGGVETPRGPSTPQVTAARLNAAQPPPPSPAKPGVSKTREPTRLAVGTTGGNGMSNQPQREVGDNKRRSGANQLGEVVTPTASTQAQFQNSTANLPGAAAANAQRMSQSTPAMSPAAQQQKPIQQEQRSSAMQKIWKALCCGRF